MKRSVRSRVSAGTCSGAVIRAWRRAWWAPLAGRWAAIRWAAFAIGLIGLLTGLTGSYLVDYPSGPTVVLALIATATVSGALAAVRLRG